MITAVSDFYLEKPEIKQFQISKSLNPIGAGEPLLWSYSTWGEAFNKRQGYSES